MYTCTLGSWDVFIKSGGSVHRLVTSVLFRVRRNLQVTQNFFIEFEIVRTHYMYMYTEYMYIKVGISCTYTSINIDPKGKIPPKKLKDIGSMNLWK